MALEPKYTSMQLIQVEPDTVISDERGNKFIVTDEKAVTSDDKMYLTPNAYKRLMDKIEELKNAREESQEGSSTIATRGQDN